MQWKAAFFFILIAFIVVNCGTQQDLVNSRNDRIRQLRPNEISSYHDAVQMQIGWMPYKEHELVLTKKNEWRVVKNEELDKQSLMPMILVTYPNSSDTVWFDMTMENETLGKLLKHTLMTQVPISRPFVDYVEIAKCGSCHPDDIEKTGFE